MTQPVTYTAKQAADLLGVSHSQVRRIAAKLGLGTMRQEQRGPVLALTEADIEAMRGRNTRTGRPKRGQ